MRIVFMGTPEFAVPSLEALAQTEHEIVSVVTNVDKRRGRGSKLIPTAVKKKAQQLDLPVLEIKSPKDEDFYESLKALRPDLLVVVAFRILPNRILDIPTRGSVNLHASLLPKYRGAAPIHWAVINGEKETGCSVFFLDSGIDTGKIIDQRSTEIGANETTGDVYQRLKSMGAELLVDCVQQIAQNSFTAVPQDDDQATPAPKLFADDARLSFDLPAEQVHNKIRGLSPFPTAWTTVNGKRFNIYRSRLGPDRDMHPGEVQVIDNQLVVGCATGTVILEEVQLAGRKRMKGLDFVNGFHDPIIIDDPTSDA
ncbi:MAG: methionyl-tRNA formyltransferase [Bacteroidota bacterium]